MADFFAGGPGGNWKDVGKTPQKPQPSKIGGDMQFAGGTPYFNERTGKEQPATTQGTPYQAYQQSGKQASAYQPYTNSAGQQFTGSMSFAPGTGADYQTQAFGNWANQNGYYQNATGAGQKSPANPKAPSWTNPTGANERIQQVSGDPMGGYASASPGQRPPPFQMAPAQTAWGQSMDPFADRNAMLQQIAAQRIQNQIAFNSGGSTNPAAGMNPWINYGQAMQQAGLGNGSPSMSGGDSLIGRLNQQYGQPLYQPPAPSQGQPSPSQPMLRPMSADEWRAAGSPTPTPPPTAYYPGFDPRTQDPYGRPLTGGPQGQSPRYSPVEDTQVPIMVDGQLTYGRDTAAKSQNARQFISQLSQTNPATWTDQQWQDYRNAQRDTGLMDSGGYYKGPDGQVYYGGGYVMEGTPAPKPIGQDAQRNQFGTWGMPPQAAPQPSENAVRVDPSTGKPVTFTGGKWTWRPNPISGVQPYDPSRFGGLEPVPGQDRPIQPPSQGAPYLQPPSQPRYGTPPERRGMWRTLDWRDADKDGVDDRDQDGPGMPAYSRPGQAQSIAPPSQGQSYGSQMTASDKAAADKRQRDYMSFDYMQKKNAYRARR